MAIIQREPGNLRITPQTEQPLLFLDLSGANRRILHYGQNKAPILWPGSDIHCTAVSWELTQAQLD